MRAAFRSLCFCGALAFAGATTALAGYTPISAPPFGEDTHAEVFSVVYGGNFHSTGPLGLDYTNDSITAVRVEDFANNNPGLQTPDLQVPLSLITSYGLDDQLWQSDYQLAYARARFAVYQENFGYLLGTSDPATNANYHLLMGNQKFGYFADGVADISSLSGTLLRWARGGENRILSSQMSDNADGLDHMVSYFIYDNSDIQERDPHPLTWLLFWEDKYQGEQLADFDFNDLVVEITALPLATVAPEPASLAVLMPLGLLALRRRNRA